jgi:hypothetical protein
MWFALLCISIFCLIVYKVPMDQYSWSMFVGLGWLAGYMDCRLFSRSDQDTQRVSLPTDTTPDIF